MGDIALAAVAVARTAAGVPLDAHDLVNSVARSPWFLGFALLLLFATVRQVLFRFQDSEV